MVGLNIMNNPLQLIGTSLAYMLLKIYCIKRSMAVWFYSLSCNFIAKKLTCSRQCVYKYIGFPNLLTT